MVTARFTQIQFLLPVAVGLLLVAPSLITGLQLDDYFHWGLVTENALAKPGNDSAGIFTLFTFLDGDAQRTQWLINKGMLPWWTLPDVKYMFWRPVAEITHGIDYLLWPKQPLLMHLHSLFYLLLLFLATYQLFKNWLTGPALTSGFWIFCLSYTQGFAAGWLANRNAVLAALFVVLSLYLHDRWRAQGQIKFHLLALITFLMGLLSGEMGVSAGLFLFAYAVCLENKFDQYSSLLKRWLAKLLTIAPYGVIGIVWLGARGVLGYGAEGSGHYVDPANLTEFVAIVAERYWRLITGLFWSLPPEFAALTGDLLPTVVAVFGFALTAVILLPLLAVNSLARFFLLSIVLLLLPVCATSPHSRLLICAGVALAGLIGLYFGERRQQKSLAAATTTQKLAPVLSLLLIISLLVLSPLLKTVSSVAMKLAMDGALNKGATQLAIEPTNQDKIHVVLNPPLSSVAGYIQGVRAYQGLPVAKAVIPLASAIGNIEFTMLSETSFRLQSEQGLYEANQESLLRAPSRPLAPGDSVSVAGMMATVITIADNGAPSTVEFQLPTGTSQYVFHLWHGGNPVKCKLPSPGTHFTLTQDRDYCAR